MDTLKDRIKMLCSARGYSLNRLETECGVAKGYLSKLDRSAPSASIIVRLASILNVSTDFLLTGSSPAASPVDSFAVKISGFLVTHPELEAICDAYVRTSTERQEIVCDLLGVKKGTFSLSEMEA